MIVSRKRSRLFGPFWHHFEIGIASNSWSRFGTVKAFCSSELDKFILKNTETSYRSSFYRNEKLRRFTDVLSLAQTVLIWQVALDPSLPSQAGMSRIMGNLLLFER